MTDREPVNIMGVIAFPEPDKSKRRIRFIYQIRNLLLSWGTPVPANPPF